MSSSGTGNGKPECLGSSGVVFLKGVSTTIVIIPIDASQGRCKDERSYPFKVIVFHDGRAQSVACFAQIELDQLRASAATAQARVVTLSAMPPPIALIISCPPPTALPDPSAERVKLELLTEWLGRESRSTAAA